MGGRASLAGRKSLHACGYSSLGRTSSRANQVIRGRERAWLRHSTHTLSSLIHTATAGTIDTRLRHTSLANTSIPAPARPCLRSFPGGAVTALSGAGSNSSRSSTHRAYSHTCSTTAL